MLGLWLAARYSAVWIDRHPAAEPTIVACREEKSEPFALFPSWRCVVDEDRGYALKRRLESDQDVGINFNSAITGRSGWGGHRA